MKYAHRKQRFSAMGLILSLSFFQLFLSQVFGAETYGPEFYETEVYATEESKAPFKLLFINPQKKELEFWQETTDFLQTAADNLGIELQVVYGEGNPLRAAQLAKELTQSDTKPEYLMHVMGMGYGHRTLQLSHDAKIKSFTFNSDILPEDETLVSLPRQKYPHWIGHMIPDDISAGKKLSEFLIQNALQKKAIAADDKVHIIALSGASNFSSSQQRRRGLMEAIADQPMAVLDQSIFSGWERNQAQFKTCILFDRHPNAQVIWAVSDLLALGARDCLEQKAKETASRHVLIGGVDGIPEALDAIREGKLAATLAGHFMEAAWALILLYDYHHGIDFIDDTSVRYSQLQLITHSNIEKYSPLFSPHNWQHIDFKRFSKAANPQLKAYDFSMDNVLKAMPRQVLEELER